VIAGLAYRWLGSPCEADLGEDRVTLAAAARTDLFVDPRGERPPVLSAPALVTPLGGDFVLGARVEVDFAGSFDAGGLIVHAQEGLWAKLCFECTPRLEPTVVSVVTRGVSDDCTSFPIDAGHMWLRIARTGPALAFHASPDGTRWHLVRHFALDGRDVLDAGFLAQSPVGEGCTARLTAIRLERRTLGDLRGGE
jgi:uncharacterized protein